MLQLPIPLSRSESEVLVRCLSQLETKQKCSGKENPSACCQSISILKSAKNKVYSQVFDDFHHEEIISMVYALDSLSRKCSKELTETTPTPEAQQLSSTLRTAASARSKLRRVVSSD